MNEDGLKDEDVVEVDPQVTRCSGLCAGVTRTNLFVMLWIWATSTTCFEMLNLYIRLLPGDVFLNFALSGVAELAG